MRVTKFHLLSMFRYYSCHTLFPLFNWPQSTQTSVLAVFLFSSFSRAHSFYLVLHMYKLLKSLFKYPICLKTFKKKKLKVTYCYFTMPKRTHVEREKAIRMLQANVTPSVIAQQFQCRARMIERLRERF